MQCVLPYNSRRVGGKYSIQSRPARLILCATTGFIMHRYSFLRMAARAIWPHIQKRKLSRRKQYPQSARVFFSSCATN